MANIENPSKEHEERIIEIEIERLRTFKEHTFSACKFFSGYKPLPLSSKVQKKTIYDFTVNDLFIVNIQFISFCFHNLATHGKCHPHIQHHLLFCTA